MSTHLDRATIDAWASNQEPGVHHVALAERETMPCGASHHGDYDCILGPATIELVVYRDGGWSARVLPHRLDRHDPSGFVVVSVASNRVVHAWGDGPLDGDVEPFATRQQAKTAAARFRRDEKRRQLDPWEQDRGTVSFHVCQILGSSPARQQDPTEEQR